MVLANIILLIIIIILALLCVGVAYLFIIAHNIKIDFDLTDKDIDEHLKK